MEAVNQKGGDLLLNNTLFVTAGEIAEELGISQAQVSRLEKSALKMIFDLKEK